MEPYFHNRSHAGQLLAGELRAYAGRPDVLVLALPRGGVPVAFEVARALGAPLDVFLVRKLGAPGQEELGMGAIASGGVRVLNDDVIEALGISPQELADVTAGEQRELDRRERAYSAGQPPLAVAGRTVLLIDDGLATGVTMRAALLALRKLGPARIVVAVPVAAPAIWSAFHTIADDIICLCTPEPLVGVGRWYKDFTQTSDTEVRLLLGLAARLRGDTAREPASEPEG